MRPSSTPSVSRGDLGVPRDQRVLVLLVLYRLVGHRWAACVGAMLFVLHPLGEPVSWASSMYSSLSGLFALLAVWQYLRFPTCGTARAAPRPAGATWVAWVLRSHLPRRC